MPRAPPLALFGPNSLAIEKLYEQDQADRIPGPGKKHLDSKTLAQHDAQRVSLIHRLYEQGKIRGPIDLYNAAVILQHGSTPEDFILAHDLAVLATSVGVNRAKWLSAATEDRFLLSIGRPQRFGTQFALGNGKEPAELCAIDLSVTDYHRKLMGAQTLAEDRRQASEMAKS